MIEMVGMVEMVGMEDVIYRLFYGVYESGAVC